MKTTKIFFFITLFFPRQPPTKKLRSFFLLQLKIGNYLPEMIFKAEKRAGLTNKVGSISANQVQNPQNIFRRQQFCSQPPPVGIVGVALEEFIDCDEAAVFLKMVNRKYGKAYITSQVRETEPYGHSQKWTMILAISPFQNLRHMRFDNNQGTTIEIFEEFLRDLIARLPRGIRFCFLLDNLKAHFSDQIYWLIYRAGYRIVPRVPYRPWVKLIHTTIIMFYI